jgi:protein phosphatase
MKPQFLLNTFTMTDIGQTSENNEDSILCQTAENKTAALLVVADGMGGHLAGEQASQLVIETIATAMQQWLTTDQAFLLEKPAEQIAQSLETAVQQANTAIYHYAQQNLEEGARMGSTAACAFIHQKTAIIANVGDSRVYLFRRGHLERLTEDHSIVERFVQEGIIKDEERYTHPINPVITRALGPSPNVKADLFTYDLEAGDRLLLCSDGLWEKLRGNDIIVHHLQGQDNLPAIGQNLINAANQAGGEDNISVILADLLPA